MSQTQGKSNEDSAALLWAEPEDVGSYTWGGAFCTYSWIDPVEKLTGVLMTQVRPYDHIGIRQDFVTLATQAIVD